MRSNRDGGAAKKGTHSRHQIKIWRGVFCFSPLFRTINVSCVTCNRCDYSFSTFYDVLSCGYDLLLSLSHHRSVNLFMTFVFMIVCERNGNVLSKTKFIDVFLSCCRRRRCFFSSFSLVIDSYFLLICIQFNLSFHCTKSFDSKRSAKKTNEITSVKGIIHDKLTTVRFFGSGVDKN